MKRPAENKEAKDIWFRTREGVAEHLEITRMTIYRWEKKARLNTPIGWGHTRSISLIQVKDWLKKIYGLGIHPTYSMHKVRELMYAD